MPDLNNILTVLSDDILSKIKEYVNINSLLNTTKKFENSKRKLFHWELNTKYSLKYINDTIHMNNKTDSIRYDSQSVTYNYNKFS